VEHAETLRRYLIAASWISIALGLWLFAAPWVFGVYSGASALNSWIVGVAIGSFAAAQLSNPRGLGVWSMLNLMLGAWTFASPWIYGYTTDTARFVNSLCVGVVVFFVSAYRARGMGLMTPGTPPSVHP
jgi:hypothetical protein